MKLGRKTWVLIIAGILVTALASLGFAYNHKAQEQAQLDNQLSLVKTTLGKLRFQELLSRQDQLQTQLAYNLSRLEMARQELGEAHNSIELTGIIFRIAKESSVKITSIDASGVTNEKVAGVSLGAAGFSITARGQAPNLIRFITGLNSGFASGVVRSAQVTIPMEDTPLAEVQLVVYELQDE